MTDAEPQGKRIRLDGERFKGGRLPVDSLVELERYQRLLRALAYAEWQQEHPDEPMPADLGRDLSLTIERIEEGSADIFLAFEQHAVYAEYQRKAESTLDGAISAAYEDRPFPEMSPLIEKEVRVGIAEFGNTLSEEQSIEIFVDGPDEQPVRITLSTREHAVDRLVADDWLIVDDVREVGNVLETEEATVVGRIFEIDADKMNFKLASLQFGTVLAVYKSNPDLLSDMKAVLDSPDVGPVTRVTGDLQSKNGAPWRFKTVSVVEMFAACESKWAAELIQLASLPAGWGDNGDESVLSFLALDAARSVLAAVEKAQAPIPGMFPLDNGGLLLEWSSAQSVRSVEIGAEATFELFALTPDSAEGTHAETTDLRDAIDFATETQK